MTAPNSWSTLADVRTKVRRSWTDGSLLRARATRVPFAPISVSIRGPKVAEIGDHLGAIQAWIAELEAGATARNRQRYSLEYKQVGGRLVGRNRIPSHAVVSDWDQVRALLNVDAEVARFDEVCQLTSSVPAARDWVLSKPVRALEFDWPKLLAAYEWLRSRANLGLYLRQVSAPGVDTKFIESHRRVLSELLKVPGGSAQFATALGFAVKPTAVRLRFNQGFLGIPRHLSEGAFRLDELSAVDATVQTAIIIENETTYLSVPVPAGGVVIFGAGFAIEHASTLPWLKGADVFYWGDLDTHGFAILDRLRSRVPHAKSVLMDRETLLAHRDRWGAEPSPTSAALNRLTAAEHQVYSDLVSGRDADRLRLEQERIDWTWATQHFPWR